MSGRPELRIPLPRFRTVAFFCGLSCCALVSAIVVWWKGESLLAWWERPADAQSQTVIVRFDPGSFRNEFAPLTVGEETIEVDGGQAREVFIHPLGWTRWVEFPSARWRMEFAPAIGGVKSQTDSPIGAVEPEAPPAAPAPAPVSTPLPTAKQGIKQK